MWPRRATHRQTEGEKKREKWTGRINGGRSNQKVGVSQEVLRKDRELLRAFPHSSRRGSCASFSSLFLRRSETVYVYFRAPRKLAELEGGEVEKPD